VFQVPTVNYFGGGESFHQNVTYLTVEAEGKGITFFFVRIPLRALGDILLRADSMILSGKWELDLQQGNIDIRTDIYCIGG
jgi:hypothetical protein